MVSPFILTAPTLTEAAPFSNKYGELPNQTRALVKVVVAVPVSCVSIMVVSIPEKTVAVLTLPSVGVPPVVVVVAGAAGVAGVASFFLQANVIIAAIQAVVIIALLIFIDL